AQQAELRERLARVRARRPWLVAAVGTLLLGLVSTTWFYVRASEAHAETARQLASAQALSRFLSEDLIRAGNPAFAGQRDVSMADAVIKAAGQVDARLAKADPAARATVHEAMRQALFYLGKYEASIAAGNQALTAWAQSGQAPAATLAQIRIDQAYVLSQLQHFPEAEQLLATAEQELRALPAPPLNLQLRLWTRRSMLLGQQHKSTQAYAAGAQAVTLARQVLAQQPDEVDASLALSALQFQSDMAGQSEHFDEALTLARELVAGTEARVGAEHLRSCYARVHLAKALGDVDQVDEALPIARRALQCMTAKVGTDNGQQASARFVLAGLLHKARHYDEAAQEFLSLSDVYRRLYGERTLGVVVNRHNAALSLREGGQLPAAERLTTETIELARPAFAADSPAMQGMHYLLAALRLDQGRTDGVGTLLAGLKADALHEGSPGEAWEAALPYEQGRYALLRGDRSEAARQLQAARTALAEHPSTQPEAKKLAADVGHWLERLNGPARPPIRR
ncbi:MAG TPA: hypothetical protein PKC59_08805, partial [Burkholderiaceae bacterium]|nr:hypothetical protein [Burkholderiaceae bacterium]